MARYKDVPSRPLASAADKEKDRKSLLEVFQKRLHSPGSIPQSLSADEIKEANKTTQQKATEQAIVLTMDSSASGKENNKPSPCQRRTCAKSVNKIKKRKSRSERNKHKSALTANKCEASAKDLKEKSDFKHHLKMAHQVMNVHPAPSTNTNIITQNRLTRRLGLFNQGKASGCIGRESLLLPESVQRQTEISLRQILSGKDTSRTSSQIQTRSSQIQTPHNITPCDQTLDNDVTLSTPTKNMIGIQPVFSSPKPVHNSPEDLPESPDIGEIAVDLLHTFNSHAIYPNRDLVKETTEELRKMLWLNNPQPNNDALVTPKTVTPSTQMYPQIALRGSFSSDTVSRGEGDGQSAHRDMDVPSERCVPHLGSGDYCPVPVPTKPVSCRNKNDYVHHQGHHTQEDQESQRFNMSFNEPQDSKAFQEYHCFHNKDLTFDLSYGHPMSRLEIQALTDGRALLALNDYRSISQVERNQGSKQDYDVSQPAGSHHANHLLQAYDMDRQHSLSGYGDVSRSLQSPMELSFNQTMMHNRMSRPTQSKCAVAEMIHQPVYMPTHPGDFNIIRHDQDECFHSLHHTCSAQSLENMDILEAIDRDTTSCFAKISATTTKDVAKLRPKKKQRFLQTSSPDSDGSPMWYAALPTLPPKPPLSPSPSLKLYPRRLY